MGEETQVVDSPSSPLSDVFPGSSVKLGNGKIVTVRKWTAREVVHEIPALLGRIVSKLTGVAELDPGSAADKIATILVGTASEAAELVAFTVRLPVGEVLDLDADEFLMLSRMMVEKNISFFGEVAKLYQLARRDLPGT